MKTSVRNDKTIEISEFGFNVEIKPYHLLKTLLSKDGVKMLDELIEKEYRRLVDYLDGFNFDNENIEFLKSEIGKSDIIQQMATFTRDILPLHSDYESIEFSDVENELLENAYSVWKYSSLYGFKANL